MKFKSAKKAVKANKPSNNPKGSKTNEPQANVFVEPKAKKPRAIVVRQVSPASLDGEKQHAQ